MVENANRMVPMVTPQAPIVPKELLNAAIVSAVPSQPEVHAPEDTTTKPVMVQMINVSKNTSNAPQKACFTGLLVFAAACAIGALPKPASLENTPRAKP